jgi:cobalt-zinc-cadmium efflux system outer membrane protein
LSFHICAARAGFACLVAIVAAGEAQAQPPLTLPEALARAADDAPAMKAADQARLSAEAGVRQANRMPNPSLDITAENLLGSGLYSGIDRAETTFGLSQKLEWGKDQQARTGLAASAVNVARARGNVRRQDLMHEVALAYLAAQKAEADLEVTLARVGVANEIVATVRRRVEAARDPLMAGAKAQAVLAEAEIGAEAVRRTGEGAKARLASFWGGDAAFAVEVASFVGLGPDEARNAASNPELALVETETERASAAIAVERARSQQDPVVSAGFRYFHETDEAALVVGVSIPLTFWDNSDGAIAQAEAERSRLRFETEAVRRNLEREVNSTRSQIAIARAEVEAIGSRLLPAAEQALALARQGYSAGGFSYLDVLDAQRLVVDAQLRRNSALFSYHSAHVALDRLTGAYAEGSAQ